MNVVIDALATGAGGSGLTHVRELALRFPELRPDHRYLFAVRPDVRAVLDAAGAPVDTVVPSPGMARVPQRLLWEHVQLPRRTRGFRPDIVFSPFNIAPTTWPGGDPSVAVMVSNLAPYAPQVLALYPARERVRFEALRRLTNRTLARADHVFVMSDFALQVLPSELVDGKAEVLQGGPPPVPTLPEAERPPGKRYIVVVADLYRYKGVEVVIQALGRLPEADRPNLVVCGRPIERPYVSALSASIDRLGLGSQVRFLGGVPHENLLGIVRGALASIACSRFENLSRVPLEAMAVGTPVLASDIPAYREACGDAASYYPVDSADALAGLLSRVTSDEDFRRGLSLAGKQAISTEKGVGVPAQFLAAFDRLRPTLS